MLMVMLHAAYVNHLYIVDSDTVLFRMIQWPIKQKPFHHFTYILMLFFYIYEQILLFHEIVLLSHLFFTINFHNKKNKPTTFTNSVFFYSLQ